MLGEEHPLFYSVPHHVGEAMSTAPPTAWLKTEVHCLKKNVERSHELEGHVRRQDLVGVSGLKDPGPL